jgi:hypothetical protein
VWRSEEGEDHGSFDSTEQHLHERGMMNLIGRLTEGVTLESEEAWQRSSSRGSGTKDLEQTRTYEQLMEGRDMYQPWVRSGRFNKPNSHRLGIAHWQNDRGLESVRDLVGMK